MARRIINNDDEVFDSNRNQVGRTVENNFYNFLVNFELRPDDENYQALKDICPDRNEGEALKYYAEYAQKMSQNEEKTMYVDFSHISSFEHEDPLFIEEIVRHFYKFEPDMNRALTKLMGHHIEPASLQKSYFQIAIFNLP